MHTRGFVTTTVRRRQEHSKNKNTKATTEKAP